MELWALFLFPSVPTSNFQFQNFPSRQGIGIPPKKKCSPFSLDAIFIFVCIKRKDTTMEASDDEFESLLMGFDIPEPTTYHDSLKGKNQSLDPSDRLDAREETASVSTTESRVVDEDLDALMDLMDDDIPDEGEGDQYREGERGEIGEGEEEGEGERGSLDNNNSGHRVVRCTTLATKPSTTQTRSCPPSLSAPTLHKGSTSSEVQTWLHSISMGEVASKFKNKSGAQMLRYKER